MQDVLVAVSKHGLSVEELTGIRELNGKVYDGIESFYVDIENALEAVGAAINIIFGNAEDWAKYLENKPHNNEAYIYFTIKVKYLAGKE